MSGSEGEGGSGEHKNPDSYSLWTLPGDEWTNLLADLSVTEEEAARHLEQLSTEHRRALEERLKPFKTPVTRATLSKAIK